MQSPMNATPSSASPLREISVLTPVNEALDRVKRVLFQPFDAGKWFIIGFTAWLAQLGENGGANFHFNTGGGRGKGGGGLHQEFEQARDYVMSNLHWIIPVVVGVVLLCLALWILFTWLSSRGRFMFLHCVALNKAEVAEPWRKFAAQGNSLFWFRIVLGLISLMLMLPLLAVGAVIGLGMVEHSRWEAAGVLWLIGVVLALIGLALVFFLIAKLTTDFVVPIMFVRRCSSIGGWRILRDLIWDNIGNMLLYLLFQIVLAMVTGILVMIVAIATCCVCCLLLVPYIGTVLLLPVFMFHRAYSAHYLAQYGPGFDAFAGTVRAK